MLVESAPRIDAASSPDTASRRGPTPRISKRSARARAISRRTRTFSLHPEIWASLRRVARDEGVLPHVRFGCALELARFVPEEHRLVHARGRASNVSAHRPANATVGARG